MKNRYIFLILAISVVVSLYSAYPISPETAERRAEDELAYYCADMNIDCALFIKIGLVKDKNGVRIFEWHRADNAKKILQVRVPNLRIGDLTIGVIGEDVTIGTLER
ncbi:hypothetical protein [Spongiibacter sp.]|uniref:hypothetical protein n=1 Tax=Spongiibacter sp. TaxID=2024860 RepID=UPI00257E80B5|nr:hypothetical protein [Spongiibacter sp.]|tara:strand:+ start:54 stop:374 length:321 start_codon:yes stop_codon:yes gene_type:complete